MEKEIVKSISILPINGLMAVYGDEKNQFATKVHGVIASLVQDEDKHDTLVFKIITSADIRDGYMINLLTNENYISDSANFLGLINDKNETVELDKEQFLPIPKNEIEGSQHYTTFDPKRPQNPVNEF